MLAKFILINDLDYEYISYASYDNVHKALNDYLCSTFNMVDLIYDDDRTIMVDGNSILYACDGDTITINGTEYDVLYEIISMIDNEFDGNKEAFVDWLTENDYLVIGQEFDEEFKDYMWNVVYAIANNNLPTVVVDFDDLFVSVHRDYDIDTAIDCVKELIE